MFETLFYVLIAFSLLSVGSLLNLIIYRLPIMLQSQWVSECQLLLHGAAPKKRPLNLFLPRSFCPACKTPIKIRHNLPILGFLLLKGRCHHCKEPISIQYPLVEILSCLLGFFLIYLFEFSLTTLFALFFVWISISLFFIDIQHQLLPDSLTLGLLWLGLIANSQELFTSLPNAVLSAAGAYLFLWLFIQLFYLTTGKIGMGNGDFKLFAALGAWFGWTLLPLILLSASLAGVLVGGLYLHVRKKTKDSPIPFGPFLCLAGLGVLFWGEAIKNWYLG